MKRNLEIRLRARFDSVCDYIESVGERNMFKRFYPYAYVDSVFAINYQKLYNTISDCIDIDNTLVHHGDDSTPEIDDLFFRIQKMGFKTLLLSNNTEESNREFFKKY